MRSIIKFPCVFSRYACILLIYPFRSLRNWKYLWKKQKYFDGQSHGGGSSLYYRWRLIFFFFSEKIECNCFALQYKRNKMHLLVSIKKTVLRRSYAL